MAGASYPWTIPTTLTPGYQYLVRATSNDGTQGILAQTFTIANNGNAFYINDGSTVGDVYTTAVGNDANSGKSPDAPMATLQALLAAYTLQPGDVIYVDTGTYNLLTNIVLGPQDSGITIQGPSGQVALFNRGLTSGIVVQLTGATNVTLADLQLTGGYYGVYAASGAKSTGLTVSNSVLFGNYSEGALLLASNDGATFSHDTVYSNGLGTGDRANSSGLDIESAGDVVTANVVYNNWIGLYLFAAGPGTVASNNQVYGNTISGIYANYNGGASLLIAGNTVFDNFNDGINAGANAVISGNTVYGQHGRYEDGTGIHANGSQLSGNVVYDNSTGVRVQYALVADNQIDDNKIAGIAGTGGTIRGNHIYANGVGLYMSAGTISYNVLEGNGTGIHDPGGQAYVDNNTIYQESGTAIQVDGGPRTPTCSTTSCGPRLAMTSRWRPPVRLASTATTTTCTPREPPQWDSGKG